MARILIMGAGAVGSYYGALLARAGHEVTLVARGAHHDALTGAGAVTVREADGTEWAARVAAAARPAGPAPDLAVITVKAHDTPRAARGLRPALEPTTPVLSLQNGVTNVARAGGVLGAARMLAGQAFVGVHVPEPGLVVHEAEGRVSIGAPEGGITPAARGVHRLLAGAWDVTLSEDIRHEQWAKLLWNVGFNAVCAVTRRTVGEVLATPESAALVTQAMEELVAVARRSDVNLGAAEVSAMLAASSGLDDYRPSTARDLAAGRPVEREALCGFVVREGARLDVDTPVNRVLDALLALQEDRALGRRARGDR